MKSNCEKDTSTSLLNNFHEIMLKDKKRVNAVSGEKEDFCNEHDSSDIIIFDPQIPELNFIESDELIYISSLIFDDILKGIDCSSCVNNLQAFSKEGAHNLIAMSSSSLSYPSENFISNLKKLL